MVDDRKVAAGVGARDAYASKKDSKFKIDKVLLLLYLESNDETN